MSIADPVQSVPPYVNGSETPMTTRVLHLSRPLRWCRSATSLQGTSVAGDYDHRVARPRLLDRSPQRGLLRYWLVRAAVVVAVVMGALATAMGRDDVVTVTVGGAIFACCVVLIVRGLVRGDLSGISLADDW